jgi:hypothetical protein
MKPEALCVGRNRREFLWETGAGFTGVALSSLLQSTGFFTGQARAASPTSALANILAPRPPHLPGKAKACIFLYMYGGPSQMDLFDYKPVLQKNDGKTIQTETRRRSVTQQTLLASKRTFRQYGDSGLWCSDALPMLSQHMDKLAVIKSLYADSFAHGSANIQMNTGRVLQGYPALGSWLGYGLGTENQNLPAFVVMLDPRGGPIPGAANWTSGFMPAAYQGTVFRSAGDPILYLTPGDTSTLSMRKDQVDTINALNAEQLRSHPGYSDLQARIASYELAYQLQSSAPELLDLDGEDESTIDMYGINDPRPDHKIAIGPAHFGRQCLVARRLVERGVRFVQIYSGGGHQQQNWDAHNGVEENLQIHCPAIDKPIAALLTDLDRRGLLDETLIVWGGEFGRQPVSQGGNGGRDHNPRGFTYWLAGGGVKGGTAYGETDEIGADAAVDRRHVRDLHATILHLMGLDHTKLSYLYNGLNQKLTGVIEAEPIHQVMA